LNNQGLGLNVITLTGQGTIRLCVLGYEDRAPKDDELNKMKNLLRKSLEDGSWGLSSGLIYIPSCFAGKEELIELTKVVKEYDGIYAAHIRNEGENLLSAVEEVIEIARSSKVKLEIAHHKASGKKNWGKVKESLNLIKKAQSTNLEVFCDQYPYLASNTSLDVLLPDWIIQKNKDYLKKNLQNKAFYLKIKKEIKKRLNVSWKDIWISCIYTKNKDCIGKNIAEIAKIKNKDPEEIILNLFIEEECPVEAIFFSMSEKDLIKVMKSPYTSIGSDAMARSPYGILSKGQPHPRAYGTFPRILGYYVRDKKILTLEEAIYKMTFFSANKLGLKKRGLIKAGNFADLVIFNPKTVKDLATFTKPQTYPQGIEYVLVNGKIVIENSKHTGILAGKILKKNN
ncbi:MAG: amidohydrolase family protein, partial [Armatimonadetes bacterium]|nr:amidohydrolase family protein [Armatimonadota bacterium]